MGCIHLVLVLGATLVLMAPMVAGCGRGAMYINRNGYREVVIAVGEDVPETPRLVERIKEVFTATSQRLYQATRNRAYLAEIKIVLPSTWTPKPEYKMAGREQMDRSDIMISSLNMSAGLQQEGMFVTKATDCGEPGHFLHLSPGLLLDAKASEIYGPLDKVLVHEFAQLRYGVFGEHPSGDVPHFYHTPHGRVEATRCSSTISGSMYDEKTKKAMCKPKGNLPDDNCRFRDKEENGMSGFGSLMYRPFLNHVDEFCDSHTNSTRQSNLHNPYAPNVHNRRCDGRSVWEACKNFLLNVVREGEMVGLVKVDAGEYVITDLTVVNAQTRMRLVDALPTSRSDFSCIGCGIRAAIKVLQENGGRPGGAATGGHLIIVTGREENKSPVIIEVVREIVRSEIIIHHIAYNDEGSTKTDDIARMTGGRCFLLNSRHTMDEAFSLISELNRNGKDRRFLIKAVSMAAPRSTQRKVTIHIDSALGVNTQFIFTFGVKTYSITITSPTGKVYLRSSSVVKIQVDGICTFTFDGQGETGVWTVGVQDESITGARERISITVVSQMPLQSDEYPVVAQAYWEHEEISSTSLLPGKTVVQTIYTSVSQGYFSVLGAVVNAVIDGPNPKVRPMVVDLTDSGSGADVHANDGIYSGYFTSLGDNGRYVVKVVAASAERRPAVVSSVRLVGSRPPTRDEQTYPDVPTPVSRYLRCESSGGSFTLRNFNKPPGKLYAPGRVTDLRMGDVDVLNRTVQLLWTAPGAELDEGRVSQYEIRYSIDFKAMVENFTGQALVTQGMLVKGELNKPSPPKAREDFVITMPRSGNITYVFRLLSKDLIRRVSQSEPSNLVSAGMMSFTPSMPSGPNTTAIILVSVFKLLFIALVVAAIIGARRVYLNRKIRPKTPTPLFVKPKRTAKVQPVSRMPAVKTLGVKPESVNRSNTLNVGELKSRGITETMAVGEAFSEPYMNTCTLINID